MLHRSGERRLDARPRGGALPGPLPVPKGALHVSRHSLLRLPLLCPQGLFMNAAVFERTDYNPLAPANDPGTHVYRLVRPVGGSTTSSTAALAGGGNAGAAGGAVDSGRLRLRVQASGPRCACWAEASHAALSQDLFRCMVGECAGGADA